MTKVTHDPKTGFPICSRCGGYIPNNETPGAYPGALSRTDNTTEICSVCGSAEGLMQAAGLPLPQPDEWPIPEAQSKHYGPNPTRNT